MHGAGAETRAGFCRGIHPPLRNIAVPVPGPRPHRSLPNTIAATPTHPTDMLPLGTGPRATRGLARASEPVLRAAAARGALRQASTRAAPRPSRASRGAWCAAAGAAAIYGLWVHENRVHLDAPVPQSAELQRRSSKQVRKDEEKIAVAAPAPQAATDSLSVYAWGANKYRVAAPDLASEHDVRIPRPIPAFDGVALRDIWMGETHAAAIDAQGDLIQWGVGFFYPESRLPEAAVPAVEGPLNPIKTLSGLNFRKVVGTEGKLYAITQSGDVWVVSGSRTAQPIDGGRKWSTLGLTSTPSAQVEHIQMQAPLEFRERFTDVATGKDHLLALTSKGRVLAAPANTFGNEYGQLAYRRVTVSEQYANPPAAGPSLDDDPASPSLTEKAQLAPLPASEGPPLPTGQAYRAFEPRMYELEDYLEREGNLTLANLLPTWAQTPEQVDSGAGLIKATRSTHPAARELVARTEEGRRVQAQLKASRAFAKQEKLKEYLLAAADITFCTTLGEIPSLRGIPMQAIAAGDSHSVSLTTDGKVLAWGFNSFGQCGFLSGISSRPATSVGYSGLTQRHAYTMEAASQNVNPAGPKGSSSACVPVPSQIDLVRATGGAQNLRCKGIRAGGDNTFFLLSSIKVIKNARGQESATPVDELYVSGKGQSGSLGNGGFSLTTASPVRIKALSGQQEYSEKLNSFVQIPISNLSVGSDGHVAAAIVASGYRDLLVWGSNQSYQLGDGRRANSALPHYLPPLGSLKYLRDSPTRAGDGQVRADIRFGAGDLFVLSPSNPESKALESVSQSPLELYRSRTNEANFQTGVFAEKAEAVIQAHTQRLQLSGQEKISTRVLGSEASGVNDTSKRVAANQDFVAGAKSSAIFWRIL